MRARNFTIALFLAGYLLLVTAMALASVSGLGAGIQAIRAGRGATVAAVLLAGIYLQSLFVSLATGFGVAAIFSDSQLRRYPLRAWERQVARHVIGIADPFWCLFLTLDLGAATGLYAAGTGAFWLGLIAILLLFLSNYLCARALGTAVDRTIECKGGGAVLILAAAGVTLPLPFLVRAHKNPAVRMIWHALPTSGAADAIVRTGGPAVAGLAIVIAWLLALAAILVLLESRGPRVNSKQSGKLAWTGPIDRIGALFGTRYGVLVAHWLRFYTRNNRFRAIYPLALPAFALLIYVAGRPTTRNPFALSIAAFSMVGCLASGQFAVNQFGYLSGGMRRFLLLPTDSAAALRAGSYVFTVLGAATIPVAALIWCLLWRQPFDARTLLMLISCGFASVFLFHGVAVWTSVLGASRGNFYQSFGNDLSVAGNLVGMGGGFSLVLGPTLLAKYRPGIVSARHWWAAPPMALVAMALYFASLHFAEAAFRARRERIMMLLEGNSQEIKPGR